MFCTPTPLDHPQSLPYLLYTSGQEPMLMICTQSALDNKYSNQSLFSIAKCSKFKLVEDIFKLFEYIPANFPNPEVWEF